MVEEIDDKHFVYLNKEKSSIGNIEIQDIYNYLIFRKYDTSKTVYKYTKTFTISETQWKQVYLLPHTLGLTNQIKETHYKTLHNYLATNYLLYKIYNTTSRLQSIYSMTA